MSHFGALSYKGAGHLNPMIALSRKLVARGHKVTFFQTSDLEERVDAHGLEFYSIGSPGARPAVRGKREYKWQVVREISSLRDGIDRIVYDMEFFLRQAPAALVAAGVDTLIMDEITLAGPTLAQILRLPYIVVSTSVPHNFGWHRPQRIAEGTIPFERVRQALLEVSVLRMRGPVRSRLDKLRRSRGLGSIRRIQQVYPELAHITQLPRCLDFPRGVIPRNFHFAG